MFPPNEVLSVKNNVVVGNGVNVFVNNAVGGFAIRTEVGSRIGVFVANPIVGPFDGNEAVEVTVYFMLGFLVGFSVVPFISNGFIGVKNGSLLKHFVVGLGNDRFIGGGVLFWETC